MKGAPFLVLRRFDKRGSDWYEGIVRGLAKRIKCRMVIVEATGREGIDFGAERPLGVFAYSVPVKDVRAALRTHGAERVPVIAFPQAVSKDRDCVSVRLDSKGIAGEATKRFDSCECASVVVAQALKFIDERARKDRKFSQHDIARHLGISTRKPIAAITFAVGFGSVSRLKALFRDRYGMTMRDWRKKGRK